MNIFSTHWCKCICCYLLTLLAFLTFDFVSENLFSYKTCQVILWMASGKKLESCWKWHSLMQQSIPKATISVLVLGLSCLVHCNNGALFHQVFPQPPSTGCHIDLLLKCKYNYVPFLQKDFKWLFIIQKIIKNLDCHTGLFWLWPCCWLTLVCLHCIVLILSALAVLTELAPPKVIVSCFLG